MGHFFVKIRDSDRSTEEEKRFQILISLLMSSQTKDEVNAAAMMRLNEKFEVLSASKAAQANEKGKAYEKTLE